jgi:hypothetical protein
MINTQYIHGGQSSGLNLYAILIDSASEASAPKYWNTSGLTFETFNAGNYAQYKVALAEEGATRIYRCKMPTQMHQPGRRVTVCVKKQAGGSPAQADGIEGVGEMVFQQDSDPYRFYTILRNVAQQRVILHLRNAVGLVPTNQAGNTVLINGVASTNTLTATDVARGLYHVQLTSGETDQNTLLIEYSNSGNVTRYPVLITTQEISAGSSPWTAGQVTTVLDGLSAIEADTDEVQQQLTIGGRLDTVFAATLADTNELQTDWKNGGRLDNLLDTKSTFNHTSAAHLANFATVDTTIGSAALGSVAQLAQGAVGGGGGGGEWTLPQIDTIIANVNAILADTNELQTDWKNGGRLDSLLDTKGTTAELYSVRDGIVTTGNSNWRTADQEWSPVEVEQLLADVAAVKNQVITVGVFLTPGERTTLAGVIDAALTVAHGAGSWLSGSGGGGGGGGQDGIAVD